MKIQLLLWMGLCAIQLNAQQTGRSFWHNGLDLNPGKAKEIAAYSPAEKSLGISYKILQFDHLLGDLEKSDLQAKGITVVDYIPDYLYTVSIKISNYRESVPVKGLLAAYTLEPAYKLSRNLLYGGSCPTEGDRSKWVFKSFDGASENDIKTQLQARGILLDRFYPEARIGYVLSRPEQLDWLAAQPWIQFIDCESEPGVPEDREGQSLHRVNLITANAKENLFLDGSGVKVMVRDDGFVGPHIDFHGRITQDVANDIGDHGDGVAGIMTGAGNYDPLIEGMAPGSDLYILNYQPDFLDKTLSYHQNEGVMITNSSYSNGCNAGYTIEAQVVDNQIHENPNLIHVFSAGNSNNQDCGYGAGNQWGNVTGGHKIGKNVLTVANLRLDGSLETSSSRGPTRDGRMKPEISARGTNQLSTSPGNGTQVFGGTSAAAPGVAGVCALLYQAYKSFHNDQNPESALIKAAIMNTATDIGTPGPDYQFGFGVIDAYRAYQLLKDQRYVNEKIKPGETKEFKINLAGGSPLAKFMLYWAEEESSLLASKVLINDLDLEVIDPNGMLLQPWVLNPTPNAGSLAAGASKGVDTLNNVEQVSVANPVAGEYTVRIKGRFMPSGELSFYLLHEVEDQSLRLSHPIGGEKFNITESTQVHYTAYGSESVSIEFSSDGGMQWQMLGTAAAGSRLFTFPIPNNLVSDSCLIRIQQGSEIRESGYFTISNGVQGFRVSRYCPREIELSWNPAGLDSVLIYQLGDRYMEPLVRTAQSSIVLPNDDPRKTKWFSIAGYRRNALSQREWAIVTPDTLRACGITRDLGLLLSANNPQQLYSCGNLSAQPEFEVINRTSNVLSGFVIKAQSSSGQAEQQYSESIPPFDTIRVSFSNGVPTQGYGVQELQAWLEFDQDENPFNDTVSIQLEIIELPEKTGNYPVVEAFETGGIPANWLQDNRQPNSEWINVPVTQKNGQSGRALMFTNTTANYRRQPIQLVSSIADLSQAAEPYLYFDFAHHYFANNAFTDSIFVKVREVCGSGQQEWTVLAGTSSELNTVDTSSRNNWLPRDTSWFWLAYDLSAFKGSKVVVEIGIIRGDKNRTLIDNLEIREKITDKARADFNINPLPACYTKQVTFRDSTNIDGRLYLWDAGLGGSPRYFNGKGSFTTRYVIFGNKRVVLKIKSDSDPDAIVIKSFGMSNPASASYTYSIVSGRTVAFKNNSTNSNTHVWDFGDGTTSTEWSPTHTFDSAKVYRVKLSVTNPCGVYNRSVNVDLTLTATDELEEQNGLTAYPNPASDLLVLRSAFPMQGIRILQADGKWISQLDGKDQLERQISLRDLTPGIYTIQVQGKQKTAQLIFEKL